MPIDDLDPTELRQLVQQMTMRLAITARKLGGMSHAQAEAYALGQLARAAGHVRVPRAVAAE